MQLINGYIVLDGNEVQALKDLAGDRFPYTTVGPEKLYDDLKVWQDEAVNGDTEGDPLRMFAKEMVMLYSAKLLDRLRMFSYLTSSPP